MNGDEVEGEVKVELEEVDDSEASAVALASGSSPETTSAPVSTRFSSSLSFLTRAQYDYNCS